MALDDRPNNHSEFIDQQRELSGAGGAKAARFLDDGSTPRSRQEKEAKARAERQAFTRLMELLQDPEYAAAYEGANDAIVQAQAALDIALEENARRMTELEGRAVKLPDGRAVFIRNDGGGETIDGEIIPASIILTLDIPEDAPTIDEYNAARERRRELGGYADKIDTARDRVNDPDDPATKDELDDITKDMKLLVRKSQNVPEMSSSFQRSATASIEQQAAQIKLPSPITD